MPRKDTAIKIRIDNELKQQLQQLAAGSGATMSEMARRLIEQAANIRQPDPRLSALSPIAGGSGDIQMKVTEPFSEAATLSLLHRKVVSSVLVPRMGLRLSVNPNDGGYLLSSDKLLATVLPPVVGYFELQDLGSSGNIAVDKQWVQLLLRAFLFRYPETKTAATEEDITTTFQDPMVGRQQKQLLQQWKVTATWVAAGDNALVLRAEGPEGSKATLREEIPERGIWSLEVSQQRGAIYVSDKYWTELVVEGDQLEQWRRQAHKTNIYPKIDLVLDI